MSADIRGNAAANARHARSVSPGEHLRAEIRRLALDQVAVSKATGVSRQSINNIINGRQPISRAMAGKLARLTGHSSDYWLRESFPVNAAGKLARRSNSNTAAATGLLVNHQIERAVRDGIVGIAPFSAMHIHAASIDLTLGRAIVTDDGKTIDLARDKGFALGAGRSVTVTTAERIGLPRDYAGRVGAASPLGSAGVMLSHALHVEPGFDAHLRCCLFNAGGRPFRLRAGDPIVSLEIVRLGATPADAT